MNLALLLRIVRNRRASVIALAVLVSMLGASYAFLMPSVYEAGVRLHVGQTAGTGFFEVPEVLSSRLVAEYGERIADGRKRDRPFLRATVVRATPGVVELTAEGDQPKDAVGLLQNVTTEIQRRHDAAYRTNVEAIRARIGAITTQENYLMEQFDKSSELIERLRQQNPVQASLLALERGRIPATITGLEAERLELVQKLTIPLSEQTMVLGEIAEPAIPARPLRFAILIMSVFSGVAIGVLFALAAESFASARRRDEGKPL